MKHSLLLILFLLSATTSVFAQTAEELAKKIDDLETQISYQGDYLADEKKSLIRNQQRIDEINFEIEKFDAHNLKIITEIRNSSKNARGDYKKVLSCIISKYDEPNALFKKSLYVDWCSASFSLDQINFPKLEKWREGYLNGRPNATYHINDRPKILANIEKYESKIAELTKEFEELKKTVPVSSGTGDITTPQVLSQDFSYDPEVGRNACFNLIKNYVKRIDQLHKGKMPEIHHFFNVTLPAGSSAAKFTLNKKSIPKEYKTKVKNHTSDKDDLKDSLKNIKKKFPKLDTSNIKNPRLETFKIVTSNKREDLKNQFPIENHVYVAYDGDKIVGLNFDSIARLDSGTPLQFKYNPNCDIDEKITPWAKRELCTEFFDLKQTSIKVTDYIPRRELDKPVLGKCTVGYRTSEIPGSAGLGPERHLGISYIKNEGWEKIIRPKLDLFQQLTKKFEFEPMHDQDKLQMEIAHDNCKEHIKDKKQIKEAYLIREMESECGVYAPFYVPKNIQNNESGTTPSNSSVQ